MKLDNTGDRRLSTWGSKKKKSNGNGTCPEYRRLRKRARRNAKEDIRRAVRED
jgi:hypothetical protein